MKMRKTKKYYRGNNLIGLHPVVGLVEDLGLIEARRYAGSRIARVREQVPNIPSSPSELLARTAEIDVDLITRGRG